MHACGKLHRACLPRVQLNLLSKKTCKRCLKAFFHTGAMATAELSVDQFPGFRNQVYFLNVVHSLSSASAKETVFLDVPLPRVIMHLPYMGEIRVFWLAACVKARHASNQFPRKHMNVMVPRFAVSVGAFRTRRTRRRESVEDSNLDSSVVTLIILALTLTHLALFSFCIRQKRRGQVRAVRKDAPRSPGAVKIQMDCSVYVGKKVQRWSQMCPRTLSAQLCFVKNDLLVPTALITSPILHC